MFGKLMSRSFLDKDLEDWHLETWSILIDRFGVDLPLKQTPVVLPTRDFFPPSDAVGHERALHVFDCVKAAMGMQDWRCGLRAQPPRVTGLRVAEFVSIQCAQDPAGTFSFDGAGQPVITYAPDLIEKPTELVAVLAHELSHLLLSEESDLVDDQTHELITDLTVAYAGLGVFGANAAFNFSQHGDAFSQGWQSQTSGYLSPNSWAFALAIFGELREDDGGMGRYLKPEIERARLKAVAYLRKNPQLLAGLRAA